MKRVALFLSLLLISAVMSANAADNRSGRIKWLTNVDEAIQLSNKTSKPIVLFFTGSDWCSWCIKLEDESLNTPEFADAVSDKFIFVKLDFPINRQLAPEITAQNKRLQKQYSVNGFPTIVIVDAQQHQLGTTGYRPGGGKQYGLSLLKLVEDNSAYKQKVDTADKQKLSSVELKQLYERAASLGRVSDAEKIVNAGIKTTDQKNFFLLEKYRLLVESGKARSKEAASIKEQLLATDVDNTRLTHYQVAIIDFEYSCRNSDDHSPQHTAEPLINYCDNFGEQDRDNLWRLQMIIAQVFYEENMLPEALEFAEASLLSSPPTVQPEISTVIHNIQTELTSMDPADHKKLHRADKKNKRRDRSRLVNYPTLSISGV